jgi:DUF4097 and DUF4098 domain-containing protein YvlB
MNFDVRMPFFKLIDDVRRLRLIDAKLPKMKINSVSGKYERANQKKNEKRDDAFHDSWFPDFF